MDYAVIISLDIDEHDDPRKTKKASRAAHKIKNVRIPSIKEPCVTVAYHPAGEEIMHIDFLIYAEHGGNKYLARRKENSASYSWEEADPEGLNDYFMEQFKDRPQLKRIIRYFKKWKYEKYSNSTNSHEVPPSIALTILACENYVEFTSDGEDDLCELHATLKAIKNCFYVEENSDGEITYASILCN